MIGALLQIGVKAAHLHSDGRLQPLSRANWSVHLMESYDSWDMNSDGLQTSGDAAQLANWATVAVLLFRCNHSV